MAAAIEADMVRAVTVAEVEVITATETAILNPIIPKEMFLLRLRAIMKVALPMARLITATKNNS